MMWPVPAVAASSLLIASLVTALPRSEPRKATNEIRNANHIFNAIHSSMRQWGSSLFHNGMSVFPAVVPAGTQFYHGTGLEEPIQGLEWLAFEPEHAIMFARSFKPPDSETKWPMDDSGQHLQSRIDKLAPSEPVQIIVASSGDEDYRPRPSPPRSEPGWLHTYRTKEATPLLYIDGMSAGKCDKGTLDSQDVLLLNASSESKGRFWERERADRLCKLAAEQWSGKIKGFIRMEAGFEIIMCSFSDSLDFVQSTRAGPFAPTGAKPNPEKSQFQRSVWEWVKFVTARYDGIGGGRVRLDYDKFITAYSYDFDLFQAHDGLPRLENASVTSLNLARVDIDTMIRAWDPDQISSGNSTDWQSVADMVVERYGKLLKYLVSGSVRTTEELLSELELTLRVFIDSDARDAKAEVDRCSWQFNPTDSNVQSSIAARSIHDVTRRICETLFLIFDINMPRSESLRHLWAIIHYLDWSVWKKCSECPFEEICFIPMWPFGAPEDRENPQCRNASDLSGRMGYWGNPGPRAVNFGADEVWA
ncbi:hypothetical protein PV04_00011 [Phialophora macrospora]|uniref:Uncharacterized protein n=1 Tax=Phialophora macrospora TaxID=1851006 RepID=A0A0D2GHK4_9EURO|nr:hypothetical protein PV04_00011 [Phialophora macrospora]